MRTTVTLDADTEQLLRRHMAERGVSFKEAINDAIRSGLASGAGRTAFTTQTASLGVSHVNLDRALQVVAELEDDELIRKMRAGR
ncbi:MAG: antitoxin [Actinomycetota bacterium]|nr:antitoxin [Actinomycetota bacterium]